MGSKNPTGKGKRLIELHIGSNNGFLPGGLLCYESKKNSSDYHDEMNGACFQEWFESVLPRLEPNSIIVIDNYLMTFGQNGKNSNIKFQKGRHFGLAYFKRHNSREADEKD